MYVTYGSSGQTEYANKAVMKSKRCTGTVHYFSVIIIIVLYSLQVCKCFCEMLNINEMILMII